jgi:hypothetical protein
LVYKATLFENQNDAGWSSLVARWAHNPKVGGSNPPPATNKIEGLEVISNPFSTFWWVFSHAVTMRKYVGNIHTIKKYLSYCI